MLSYYITFYIERALAPMLFRDDDKEAAEAARTSPVAPTQRSASAASKAATKRTAERLPAHSLSTLLFDLVTICADRKAPTDANVEGFVLVTTPTAIQRHALDLFGVSHRLGYA